MSTINLKYRQAFQHAFEKEASILGTAAIIGGLHIIPNILNKALRTTKVGQKILADTMRAGYEHGLYQEKLSPNIERLFRLGIGPETLAEYQLARRAGELAKSKAGRTDLVFPTKREITKALPKEFQQLASKAETLPLLDTFALAEQRHTAKTPSRVYDYLLKHKTEAGRAPTRQENLEATLALTVAAALEPTVLLQPLFSKTRSALAQTNFGQQWMKNDFAKGLRGESLSREKELLSDIFLSPGFLETNRTGRAIREKAIESGIKEEVLTDISKQVEQFKRSA